MMFSTLYDGPILHTILDSKVRSTCFPNSLQLQLLHGEDIGEITVLRGTLMIVHNGRNNFTCYSYVYSYIMIQLKVSCPFIIYEDILH